MLFYTKYLSQYCLRIIIECLYIYFGFRFIPLFPDISPSNIIPEFSVSKKYLIDMIQEATTFLNLPVWSRNYKSCLSPKSEIDGLDYNSIFKQSNDSKCKNFGHWPIIRQEYWQRNSYKSLKEANAHITVSFCFPYFILTEPGFSQFIYKHFGIHYVYFITNFAFTFDQKVRDYVNKLIGSIPKSIKIIGVHIRTHENKGYNYIYSEEKVKNVIIPFINQLLENKNYVAIATDWMIYVNLFKKVFKNKLILADVMRKPDGDQYDASIDIRLLMSCNKMIGSYKSTFSSMAGMLAMHKVFYVAMEYPKIFQFSNSQAGIISGIYENVSDFNYFVNQRIKLYSNVEPALRTFFKNIVY